MGLFENGVGRLILPKNAFEGMRTYPKRMRTPEDYHKAWWENIITRYIPTDPGKLAESLPELEPDTLIRFTGYLTLLESHVDTSADMQWVRHGHSHSLVDVDNTVATYRVREALDEGSPYVDITRITDSSFSHGHEVRFAAPSPEQYEKDKEYLILALVDEGPHGKRVLADSVYIK